MEIHNHGAFIDICFMLVGKIDIDGFSLTGKFFFGDFQVKALCRVFVLLLEVPKTFDSPLAFIYNDKQKYVLNIKVLNKLPILSHKVFLSTHEISYVIKICF